MVKYSTESDYVDTDLFAFYGNVWEASDPPNAP